MSRILDEIADAKVLRSDGTQRRCGICSKSMYSLKFHDWKCFPMFCKRVASEYTLDFFQSVKTAEDDETQLEFEPIVGGACR
jgi:hypothetical protein